MSTHTALDEVTIYLQNNDSELALRRLLDAALDSGEPALIDEAIVLSKKVRKLLLAEDVQAGKILEQEAATLIQKLQQRSATDTAHIDQLLTATGITKKYKKGTFGLAPISLSVQTGQVLGIVGENGNGKTTLLRLLGGQLAQDAGSIEYHTLPGADYYSIKSHVAFIPQRIPRWYGGLKDNLHFSAAISGIVGDDNERMVTFMLERFNLSGYAHLTWDRISSGYRTRFEIARVLLQRPKLLILDEPLANLDIKAQQTLLTDLVHLAKGNHNGMGVLLSSQQLHEVEKVADSVLFLRNGALLYNTTEQKTELSATIEIESTLGRQAIQDVLKGFDIQVEFDGSFYTLTSESFKPSDMLQLLISKHVAITYYRDITNSTKRFFK